MIMAATPAARAARWPLGFAAVVLAYWAFDYSLASNMRRANPEAAYRARPTDPGAVAAAMNDRMVARSTFEADADDAANARAGLGEDPLNRVLLRTLGVRAEITGRQQDAYRAMQMASRVSRRDSITELWLAEYHRRNNEPVKALVHYDAAMLVRPDLQKALFPQMVPALAQEDFRAAVRPYIVRKASWTYSFVGTAASSNGDLENTYRMINPITRSMATAEFHPATARVIHWLAEKGDSPKALALAKDTIPDFNAQQFSETGWNDATTDRRMGQLAWSFKDDANFSVSIEPGNRLAISASPLATGEVATRDFIVNPGSTYRFSHAVSDGPSTGGEQLKWTASCITGRAASAVALENQSARPSASFSAEISVSQNCHLLRLTAVVLGSDSGSQSELILHSIKLST
ncbi:tetratricopeptide repeat protein [Blastomonas sp.]|uniref:tetratricopeptide repeat protein n=1 Tax=Blastomonas sp. TaxID=1909299 RepID=UPI00391BD030